MYSKTIVQSRLARAEADLNKALGKFALRDYTPAQVQDWNDRISKSYDLAGGLIRPLGLDEQAFILNEVTRCKFDFEYWASRYCTISSSEGRLVPLVLREAQRKLLARIAELEDARYPMPTGKVGLIVAKARRAGATVLGQAIVAHGCMLRPQAMGLIASDIPENTLKLYQIQERIYDNLPVWMRPNMSGRVKSEHMHFDGLDSDLTCGTGNQKNPMGQGIRLDFIHFTEVSTWEVVGIEQIDEDVYPAFDSSGVATSCWLMESTGKGGSGNFFHDQYQTAKANKGSFRAIFLSWYDVPEMHTRQAEGMEFSETTKAVARRIRGDTGYDCTRDQLAWYQITREQFEAKSNLEGFLQEYPSTDEECFQYGLRSVFTLEVRDRVRNAVKPLVGAFDIDIRRKKLTNRMSPSEFDGKPDNRLLVYEWPPRKDCTYVMGVDVSYGVGRDRYCIHVNRVGNRHFPDEQVAEISGQLSPIDCAIPCWIVGHMYTDRDGIPAKMAIEVNPGSPGLMTQVELQRMGYANFYIWKRLNVMGGGYTKEIGWQTTPATRAPLTKMGVEYINKDQWNINSPFFIEEMKTFVDLGPTKAGRYMEHFEHAPGCNDDRLFAGFIALWVSHEDDQRNLAQERIEQTMRVEASKAQNYRPVNFQNMAIFPEDEVLTYDDFKADWEAKVIGTNFDY